MFSIVISEKGGAERRETFEQSQVTVGRVQGNDLMLPKGNVSKRHCSLVLQDGRFVVTDQNSTNGTYVNRRRISASTVVRQGDRIYVGDFVLRIEDPADDQPNGAEAVQPENAASPATPAAVAPSLPPRPPPLPKNTLTESRPSRSSQKPPAQSVAPGPRTSTIQEIPADFQLGTIASAVRELVERALSKLEPRALNRVVDEALERRVKRGVSEALATMRSEGRIPEGVEEQRLTEPAMAELIGLGPLTALLEDDSVTEIAASGVGHLQVFRGAQLDRSVLPFCVKESIERVTHRLLRGAGIDPAQRQGPVREWLPNFSVELEALTGALAPQGGVIHVKRRVPVDTDLEELVRAGTVSRAMVTFLRLCLAGHANVLVVGPDRSGAAEVIAALRSAVEGERFLAVRKAGDLGGQHPDVVPLVVDEPGSAPAVIDSASRFPGHRLLVECLQGEVALATVTAINQGANGVLVSLRAQSVERGLSQLCAELSLIHGRLTPEVLGEALVAGFDVVVEVARLPDGRSRVLRICELETNDHGQLTRQDVFEFVVERTATGGHIEGTFRPTGRSPRIALELRARGTRVDTSLFTRS